MKKKKQKFSDKQYNGYHLVGIGLFSLFATYLMFMNIPTFILHSYETGSCEGIDEYFTNTSFNYDEIHMYETYRENYGTGSLEPGIQPPKNIKNGTLYDCEDYALAVKCLGKQYDVECQAYLMMKIGKMNDIETIGYKPQHMRVECNVNGKWKIIN